MSTADVIAVLRHVAEKREDVFTLLQCERVQKERTWRSIYRELPLQDLSLDGSWQYLIRSRTLHPAIPAPEPRKGVGWPGEFALNGLILLNHPDAARRSETPGSSIGIVNRIANERDGSVHDHSESDALFGALKRALKAAGARAG
jgi:hypothetical protein